jgi:hypothetical protein
VRRSSLVKRAGVSPVGNQPLSIELLPPVVYSIPSFAGNVVLHLWMERPARTPVNSMDLNS